MSLDRCKVCGLIKCVCPKRLTWNAIKYTDQSEKEYFYWDYIEFYRQEYIFNDFAEARRKYEDKLYFCEKDKVLLLKEMEKMFHEQQEMTKEDYNSELLKLSSDPVLYIINNNYYIYLVINQCKDSHVSSKYYIWSNNRTVYIFNSILILIIGMN